MLSAGLAKYWPLVEQHGRHGYAIKVYDSPEERRANWEPPSLLTTGLLFNKQRILPKRIRLAIPKPKSVSKERDDIVVQYDKGDHDQFYRDQEERRLKEIPWSRSRFGGLPEVSPDVEWPEESDDYYDFLGQIFLSELPDSPARARLPADGSLSFFVHRDPSCNDYDLQWTGRVVYQPESTQLVQVDCHPRKKEWRKRSQFFRENSVIAADHFNTAIAGAFRHSLEFVPYFYLPSTHDTIENCHEFWGQFGEWDSSDSMAMSRVDCKIGHEVGKECGEVDVRDLSRLIGHYYVYQHNLRIHHAVLQAMKQPVLLFQMMRWGPYSPEFYFFIEKDELNSLEFSNVKVLIDHN